MGALVVLQIHLGKVQSSGFPYVQGNEKLCKTGATSRIPLMISTSVCKTEQKPL